MEREIKHNWYLPHPPKVVWEYLTDSELLSQWLMKNDFKPIEGHEFQFKTKPKIKMGFDGNIYCKVLEVKPTERLSYSWKGGPGNGKINLDSKVTWTLTPKDDGTELLLEHTGFKGWENYLPYLAMNKGWGSKVKKRLMNVINSQQNETANI